MKCRLIATTESEIKQMVKELQGNFLVANLTIRKSSNPKYQSSFIAYFELIA